MRIKHLCLILTFASIATINCQAQSSMTQKHNLPALYNDDGDNFVIIAHRGASAYYPENTMIAFKKAVKMGAEMIELDIMMSKDGVPIVFHDAKLNKHTNGNSYVKYYTLEDLKKLDAGSWFDAEFSDQKIPTLEEVLKFASENIALNIEIKTEAVSNEIKNGIEEKALQLVKKYGMEKHVLFSSFNYRAIRHLKKLDPNIPAALLYEKKQSNRLLPHQLVEKYNVDAFNCSYRQLKRKWMADLDKHDIPTFIYTVDSKKRMQKLIAGGVTGIFTNKPDLLKSVVQSYHLNSTTD
ncbi:glycerophosphodiester phosphodiesterase [Fodinibius sp.]|uniref:glycerophosphodiester phosphodiesterase n=1 Tax=Fodinibius sp. TaxID=1872440 RepID=UPI002ACDFBA4|nr:glycerophosphodiester phosphodiesterase family protein [Fodinibius sp.]MDZ7658407.1 glycerophosphodiester phosphodiesterase family protein [Fodinibius sp.]